MSDERINRNIQALEQAAQQDRERTFKLQEELRIAQNAIVNLTGQVTLLQQQLMTVLARTSGRGPTT